jgi:hypothetical protein
LLIVDLIVALILVLALALVVLFKGVRIKGVRIKPPDVRGFLPKEIPRLSRRPLVPAFSR